MSRGQYHRHTHLLYEPKAVTQFSRQEQTRLT